VAGLLLFTPRSGGANALKGFAFQEAYSRLRLVWLLTCKCGVVEVRYEGAQDVDIRMGDGSQRFVQAKDYAWGSLSTLYDALAGFTRDLICAKTNGGTADELPKFCIVSTTPPVEPAAMELHRGVYLKRHAAQVAIRVKAKYRNGLDNKAVLIKVSSGESEQRQGSHTWPAGGLFRSEPAPGAGAPRLPAVLSAQASRSTRRQTAAVASAAPASSSPLSVSLQAVTFDPSIGTTDPFIVSPAFGLARVGPGRDRSLALLGA